MKLNNSKVVSTKDITNQIKTLVLEAINDSYAVVEIANEGKKKGKEDGIVVKFNYDKTFSVDVHVTMAQGVKITEALIECQKIIKYRLERKLPGQCSKVNIYAMKISSK